MKDTSKRIAFNTIYLYASSIIQLFLGLYMSRVILQALGVTDFGIYGVVGSIVVVLNFLSTAMGGASMRYLSFELAEGTIDRKKEVFSAVFTAHVGLALILFIFAETLGLWYLCTVMVIPQDRIVAAHWVYQSSIIIAVINIIRVPFTANITANEYMGFSSFWSIIESLLRFLGAIILLWLTMDKLIAYAVIMVALTIFIFIGYFWFCTKNFSDTNCRISHNKKMLKGILSFAGYSAFSSSSSMMRIQGNNLLINKFFGVVMNASVSIASMVSGYIAGFTMNIITAFRPQIIKKYASNDLVMMSDDMTNCLKFCMAIFSLFAVPIFIEITYVLDLWLGKVPDFSGLFCRISLIGSLFNLMGLVVIVGIQATDRVKVNSLMITAITFVSLFVTLLLLQLGLPAYIVYVISVCADIIILWQSIRNLKFLIPQFESGTYISIILKIILFMLIGAALALLPHLVLQSSFVRLVLVTITYTIVFGGLFWVNMLDKEVKHYVIGKILAIKNRQL